MLKLHCLLWIINGTYEGLKSKNNHEWRGLYNNICICAWSCWVKHPWYYSLFDTHLFYPYQVWGQSNSNTLAMVQGSQSKATIIINFEEKRDPLSIFFKIGIYSMQGWTATARHGVTRKRSTKRLQHTANLFRKNLQLSVC